MVMVDTCMKHHGEILKAMNGPLKYREKQRSYDFKRLQQIDGEIATAADEYSDLPVGINCLPPTGNY